MSICKVTILGNLTGDPEQRTTPGGNELADFSLAVNSYVNKEQTTAFYRCTMWGKRSEVLARSLKKGSPLLVVGSLTVRSYQAKDGTTKQSLEVNVDDFSFVGTRSGAAPTQEAESAAPAAPEASKSASDAEAINLSDIPF